MAISLLVVPVTATAQEELGVGREVVVTGAPGERPTLVYGAANIGVQLIFDAPLQRTDAGTALHLPGGDIRLHPYLESSLFVTPSRTLANGPAVPLHVALTDGGVSLLLAFQQGRIDHVLRILQRPPAPDAGANVPRAAFQQALSGMAAAIFKDNACAPLQSQLVRAEVVNQAKGAAPDVLVCAAGTLNYLRVPRKQPGCAVSSARLLREGKDVEVLLQESVQSKKESWQVLAVWSPSERTEGFELLLLAADGTLCEKHPDLVLGPGDSP